MRLRTVSSVLQQLATLLRDICDAQSSSSCPSSLSESVTEEEQDDNCMRALCPCTFRSCGVDEPIGVPHFPRQKFTALKQLFVVDCSTTLTIPCSRPAWLTV